jgi:hypothetical protein
VPALKKRRTTYGGGKYAAFHLLLARMFRLFAPTDQLYKYVTFGGTELRDTRTVHFIDSRLLESAVSFEAEDARYKLAAKTADGLRAGGPDVEVINDNFFEAFTRPNTESRHCFFIDFEGRCAFSDIHVPFSRMFRKDYIAEDDFLLITSFLGGRKKNLWEEVAKEYDAEFRILGITKLEEKKAIYRACHPSFTLRRALAEVGMQDELAITCFGFVAYLDTSPMGVYGYSIGTGRTELHAFLNTPRFELYGPSW